MHISLVYIQSSDFGIGVYNLGETGSNDKIQIVKTYVDVSKI